LKFSTFLSRARPRQYFFSQDQDFIFKTETETSCFVPEVPRHLDPSLEDYITAKQRCLHSDSV